MASRVLMPKGSDTMTEGKVLKWLKNEGDKVASGDALVEIETDKVDMEVESMAGGVLRKVMVQAGATVPVGQLLAVIGGAEEDISSMVSGDGEKPAQTSHAEVSRAEKKAEATPEPGEEKEASESPQQESTGKGGRASASAQPHSEAPAAQNETARSSELETEEGPEGESAAKGGRILASPLARRLARDAGLDLSAIRGSGPGGRIIRRDVEGATASGPVRVPRVMPSPQGPEYHDEPLSSMRKTIALRLVQSLGPIPHFYLTIEVDMRKAKELRESANRINPDLKLSFNDIIIKACASALTQHPDVNASYTGEAIRFHNRIHLSIAVAIEGGLITPVIRNCDRKTLQQVSAESDELISRARGRKLKPEEYTGGTFSVSNLGMMGIEEFSAIINPPEGAILAVGAVLEKPVVEHGQVTVGYRCRMTLSCDHRVVDGATGARFLQTLQEILENPVSLLL